MPRSSVSGTSASTGRRWTARPYSTVSIEDLLSDLLHELFPDGLTDDCPARRAKATA
jgi:hypothetical protein